MSERPNNRRTIERRHFIAGVTGSMLAPLATAQTGAARRATPTQTLGPFYPRDGSERPKETDADLIKVDGERVLTRGVPIYLTGRVVDRRGDPIANAAVEIWQCDANAVYHHPAGGAENERDPGFQGYGVTRTDASGSFHFRTIRPVAYPGRTPHIHVRVQSAGLSPLATQLYLADDPGNRRDFLYSRLSSDEQAALNLRLEPSAGISHPLAQATRFVARTELMFG